MNDNELCALRSVIDYLWKDEKKNYAERDHGKDDHHIYLDLVTLKEYLDRG